MQIEPNHIAYKKLVGKLNDKKIFELRTTGGLNMIVVADVGKSEVLGVGPHRAIARHIAKKKCQDIEWTELSKSDHLEPQYYEHLLPTYEALTEEFRNK